MVTVLSPKRMLVVYDIGYQASNKKRSFDLTSKRMKRESLIMHTNALLRRAPYYCSNLLLRIYKKDKGVQERQAVHSKISM